MRQKLGSQAQVVKLGPETDYGLFAASEPGSKSGVWLDLDLQIEDYMGEGKPVVLKSGVNHVMSPENCFVISIFTGTEQVAVRRVTRSETRGARSCWDRTWRTSWTLPAWAALWERAIRTTVSPARYVEIASLHKSLISLCCSECCLWMRWMVWRAMRTGEEWQS